MIRVMKIVISPQIDVDVFLPHDEKRSQHDDNCDDKSDEKCEWGDEYGMVDQNEKGNHHHLGVCSKFHSLEGDDSLPNKDCVMRRCTHCGINKYRQLIEKNNPQINTSTDELKW